MSNPSPKDPPAVYEEKTEQMNPTDQTKGGGVPLEELFSKQMDMEDKDDPAEFPVNEDQETSSAERVLLVKPHGFKPPPIKIVAANLQNAWRDIKGVQVTPNRYVKDLIVCIFRNKDDLEKVLKGGAWTVRASHLQMSIWDRTIPMERVPLDSVNFWIQIRGMPPEKISFQNIRGAAAKAGEVLDVEWKDSIVPKWLTIPKALIKVRTKSPLVSGFSMWSSTGKKLKVYFKYEKLSTFYYYCGILGHDQGTCSSEGPVDPDEYGPWLRYDENADILPPNIDRSEEEESPEKPIGGAHDEEHKGTDGSKSEKGKQKIHLKPTRQRAFMRNPSDADWSRQNATPGNESTCAFNGNPAE